MKCAMCGIKKSRFIKKQETSGILSNLGLKTTLSWYLVLNAIPLNAVLLNAIYRNESNSQSIFINWR